MYCIYSVKRRGVYYIFRDSSAAFIRGRCLFEGVYLKYTLFLASMVTNYFNFEKQKRFSARLKCHFFIFLIFTTSMLILLQYIVGKVNENLMSDMLSQHQNWCIQKDTCLVHSKLPTAIEALIAVLFESIIQINAASCCGVYSRAAFINISSKNAA